MKKGFLFFVVGATLFLALAGCDKSVFFKTVAELDSVFYLNQVQEPSFSLYQDFGYAKEKIVFEPNGAVYEFQSLDESIQKSAISNALKFTKEGTFVLEGTIKVLNLPYKVNFKEEVVVVKENLKGIPIVGPSVVFSDDVAGGKSITYKLPVGFGSVRWSLDGSEVADITEDGGVVTFKKAGAVKIEVVLSDETYACKQTLDVVVKKSFPQLSSLKITKAKNSALSVEEYVATFDGSNYEFVLSDSDYLLSNLVLTYEKPDSVTVEAFPSVPVNPASNAVSCTLKKTIFAEEESFSFPIVFKKAK